jgi:hypothetical protein
MEKHYKNVHQNNFIVNFRYCSCNVLFPSGLFKVKFLNTNYICTTFIAKFLLFSDGWWLQKTNIRERSQRHTTRQLWREKPTTYNKTTLEREANDIQQDNSEQQPNSLFPQGIAPQRLLIPQNLIKVSHSVNSIKFCLAILTWDSLIFGSFFVSFRNLFWFTNWFLLIEKFTIIYFILMSRWPSSKYNNRAMAKSQV